MLHGESDGETGKWLSILIRLAVAIQFEAKTGHIVLKTEKEPLKGQVRFAAWLLVPCLRLDFCPRPLFKFSVFRADFFDVPSFTRLLKP